MKSKFAIMIVVSQLAIIGMFFYNEPVVSIKKYEKYSTITWKCSILSKEKKILLIPNDKIKSYTLLTEYATYCIRHPESLNIHYYMIFISNADSL